MKLFFSLLALTGFVQAQSLSDWLGRLTNTEEHLVHREQVGPYLVSGEGQRLLEHPYLKLDIRQEGVPIAADSTVRVDATLHHAGEQSTTSYIPRYDDGVFVIDPLELGDAENWPWDSGGWLQLELTVAGAAGTGTGEFGFSIYPPKPAAGTLFRLLNFGTPFLTLAVFAGVYKLRRVSLQRRTA